MAKHTPKITESFRSDTIRSNLVKEAELKLIAFLIEHNLPFRLMDHLAALGHLLILILM